MYSNSLASQNEPVFRRTLDHIIREMIVSKFYCVLMDELFQVYLLSPYEILIVKHTMSIQSFHFKTLYV